MLLARVSCPRKAQVSEVTDGLSRPFVVPHPLKTAKGGAAIRNVAKGGPPAANYTSRHAVGVSLGIKVRNVAVILHSKQAKLP